jgi:hypothetical protein
MVVFAVDPDAKYSEISQTVQSLIRENFVSLVIQQPPLRLTTSLFGEPSLFEVQKFPGGITIIPPQSAFLLQKVKILFNFTLNFPIDQIQKNFDELTSQLKSGLNLVPYEVWQSSVFCWMLPLCISLPEENYDVVAACSNLSMSTNFLIWVTSLCKLNGPILPTTSIYFTHENLVRVVSAFEASGKDLAFKFVQEGV